MHEGDVVLLVVAAALGGALNSVAGGGSFFTFPALVFAGVPPIPANATSALALWPGSLASALAYRREVAEERGRLAALVPVSLLGGAGGGLLLLYTPSRAFEQLVPFLLLLATVLFAAGPRLTAWIRTRAEAGPALSSRGIVLAQLGISVYGGYFGGGMGMMMLAAYALLGMEDLHRMNGVKTLLAVGINAAAIVTFAATGLVIWTHGLLMAAGAVAGGYGGAALARRIPQKHVRAFIVISGVVLTAVFFQRAYLGG